MDKPLSDCSGARWSERTTLIRRYTANVRPKRTILALCRKTSGRPGAGEDSNESASHLPIRAATGAGSKLPVHDGPPYGLESHGLDPRGQRKHGYAVIEPGVTQRMLHDRLSDAQSACYLSVTGSGAETSILGNTLDRGIAHHGPRAELISGLEVVLGTGEVIRTGSGHLPQSQTTYLYRHGIGPSLDGLFCQSNFGIVTRAAIKLMRRKPAHGVLGCRIARRTASAPVDDGAR